MSAAEDADGEEALAVHLASEAVDLVVEAVDLLADGLLLTGVGRRGGG